MARKASAGVSLNDVAKLAGVSAQTASRVANGSSAVRPETKERVIAAMRQLGYRPSFAARSLRLGSYHSIGLVMPNNVTTTGRRFQAEGMAVAAAEHHYALTIVQVNDDELTLEAASRRMASLPVDGQILGLGLNPTDFDTFIPPAAINSVIISTKPHPWCPTVSNDQLACSTAIVEHLISKGHREIRYAGGRPDSPANIERCLGWKQTLQQHGLPVAEPLFGDWTADSGYRMGAILAKDAACTAIYAANDTMAIGIICALRDAGRSVPHDVSVIGVDDSLVGIIPRLELSSYRFDHEQVGAAAFNLAISAPTSETPPHILVPGELVERSSVVPPTH